MHIINAVITTLKLIQVQGLENSALHKHVSEQLYLTGVTLTSATWTYHMQYNKLPSLICTCNFNLIVRSKIYIYNYEKALLSIAKLQDLPTYSECRMRAWYLSV